MKTFKYFMGFFALMVSVSLFVSCGDDDPIVDGDDPEEYKTDSTNSQDSYKGACPDQNHPHAIDLGLPSGTKWCCCNVGAESRQEYGDYFAWGETAPKDNYSLQAYSYYDASSKSYTNIGSDISGTAYDAAKAQMGEGWCMPAQEQWEELLTNCTTELVVSNNVNCMRVKSKKNDRYIYLPLGGSLWGTSASNRGTNGTYWSSTLGKGYGENACVVSFGSGFCDYDDYSKRYGGLSVRAVRVEEE